MTVRGILYNGLFIADDIKESSSLPRFKRAYRTSLIRVDTID